MDRNSKNWIPTIEGWTVELFVVSIITGVSNQNIINNLDALQTGDQYYLRLTLNPDFNFSGQSDLNEIQSNLVYQTDPKAALISSCLDTSVDLIWKETSFEYELPNIEDWDITVIGL